MVSLEEAGEKGRKGAWEWELLSSPELAGLGCLDALHLRPSPQAGSMGQQLSYSWAGQWEAPVLGLKATSPVLALF